MKKVTNAKGLSDLRTATTTRLHSKPPLKGTVHLELYLLSREKERLDQELARLEQRQGRIQAQLLEIRQAMVKLEKGTERAGPSEDPLADLGALDGIGGAGEEQPVSPIVSGVPALQHSQQQWRKMALDY